MHYLAASAQELYMLTDIWTRNGKYVKDVDGCTFKQKLAYFHLVVVFYMAYVS
jgi:hypothetical protein